MIVLDETRKIETLVLEFTRDDVVELVRALADVDDNFDVLSDFYNILETALESEG